MREETYNFILEKKFAGIHYLFSLLTNIIDILYSNYTKSNTSIFCILNIEENSKQGHLLYVVGSRLQVRMIQSIQG